METIAGADEDSAGPPSPEASFWKRSLLGVQVRWLIAGGALAIVVLMVGAGLLSRGGGGDGEAPSAYERRVSELVPATVAANLSARGAPFPVSGAKCNLVEASGKDGDSDPDRFSCVISGGGQSGSPNLWSVLGPVATQVGNEENATPVVTRSIPVSADEAEEQFRPFLFRLHSGYEPGREEGYECQGPEAEGGNVFYCSFAYAVNDFGLRIDTVRRVVFGADGSVMSFREVPEVPVGLGGAVAGGAQECDPSSVEAEVTRIEATGINCETAQRIADEFFSSQEDPSGWDCTYVPQNNGYPSAPDWSSLRCAQSDAVFFDVTWDTPGPPSISQNDGPSSEGGGSGRTGWNGWEGGNGYTAVLASENNLADAKSKATDARSAGLPADILRSSDFSSLRPGYWVVFLGRFKTQRAAAEEAGKAEEAGFSGAYARSIKR